MKRILSFISVIFALFILMPAVSFGNTYYCFDNSNLSNIKEYSQTSPLCPIGMSPTPANTNNITYVNSPASAQSIICYDSSGNATQQSGGSCQYPYSSTKPTASPLQTNGQPANNCVVCDPESPNIAGVACCPLQQPIECYGNAGTDMGSYITCPAGTSSTPPTNINTNPYLYAPASANCYDTSGNVVGEQTALGTCDLGSPTPPPGTPTTDTIQDACGGSNPPAYCLNSGQNQTTEGGDQNGGNLVPEVQSEGNTDENITSQDSNIINGIINGTTLNGGNNSTSPSNTSATGYCSNTAKYSLSSKFTPLIQCGGTNADGSPQHCCDFNEAAILVNRLINWFISISVAVAAITFSIAGGKMLMNPGSEEEWRKAKEMFSKTVYGLLIVLGAWLVIHAIISTLVNGNIGALRFFSGN